MITKREIELKLLKLREEWKQNPDKRPIIEVQGKCLARALETAKDDPLASSVIETMF